MQQTQQEAQNGYSPDFVKQEDQRKKLNLDVITADANLAVEKQSRDFIGVIVVVSCIAIVFTIAAIALSVLDFRGAISIVRIIFPIAVFIIGETWLTKKKKEKDSQSVENLDFIIEEDAVIRKREYDISSDTSTNMQYEAKFAVNGFREVDKELYDRLSLCDRVYILKRKGTNGRDAIVRYYPESEYRLAPELEQFAEWPLLNVSQEKLEEMVQDERNKLIQEHEDLNQKALRANGVAAWIFLIAGIIFLAFGLYGMILAHMEEWNSAMLIMTWILLGIGAVAFVLGYRNLPKKK